jgi:hypothetical protein
MRGVEQLVAAQAADCTVTLVRAHNPFAELALMQALLKQTRRIASSDFGFLRLGWIYGA